MSIQRESSHQELQVPQAQSDCACSSEAGTQECSDTACSDETCLTSECIPSEFSTPILLSSRVKLYPYLARREGEEYIVGRPELAVYISVPPIGVEAMKLLEEGLSVSEVAARLQEEDEVPSDIADFVQTLIEYGLVAELDGEPVIVTVDEEDHESGIEVFRRLKKRQVGWLFGKPALVVYAIMLLLTVLLLVSHPQLIPTSDNFFVLYWSYAVNTLLMMATSFSLIFVHELGHLCAARTMDIDGRLSVGRRLYTLVAECRIGSAWQLPRRQRLLIYSAGMITNLVVFFLSLVLVVWAGPMLPTVAVAFLKLVLVLEWYGTAWQLLFYMQTDVYYIVADLFHAKNLMQDAEQVLRQAVTKRLSWLGRLLGSGEADLSTLPPRERRFVQVYAVFYVLGVGLALALFVIYLLPFLVRTNVGALLYLLQGPRAGVVHLTDGVVTLLSYSISYGLLAWMWWHDWRGRLHRIWSVIRSSKQTKTKAA